MGCIGCGGVVEAAAIGCVGPTLTPRGRGLSHVVNPPAKLWVEIGEALPSFIGADAEDPKRDPGHDHQQEPYFPSGTDPHEHPFQNFHPSSVPYFMPRTSRKRASRRRYELWVSEHAVGLFRAMRARERLLRRIEGGRAVTADDLLRRALAALEREQGRRAARAGIDLDAAARASCGPCEAPSPEFRGPARPQAFDTP